MSKQSIPGPRSYELTYILGERTNQPEAQTKLEELTKQVKEMGGSVTKHELWGRRELAYPIKRNRSGFYTTLWLDLPANQLKALQTKLHFDESIIRSLITKAFVYAQAGSLYPVSEAEKETPASKDDKASAEAMLRMGNSRTSTSKKAEPSLEPEEVELPEEERLKKLDEKLDELLQDDENA